MFANSSVTSPPARSRPSPNAYPLWSLRMPAVLSGALPPAGATAAAVQAGLTLKWSNGQTEGQIQRLKLLKRQAYGRARLPLLRQRVLYGPHVRDSQPATMDDPLPGKLRSS